MAAKVVKLAVIPAALGLASFRVYTMTEDKTEGLIAPRELSVYSAETPALRYVEERPGRLQTGLGRIRERLQRYVTAVQNTCTSVRVGALSLYQTGQDTYDFLRDPPPGFLPRVSIIAVSGLAGLILARKGSRLKRIGVPVALTAASAAVCYPVHTVGVLKVTGKKVYAASSLVASVFRSKPKEDGFVPDARPEPASEEAGAVREVAPQPAQLPEQVPSLPGVAPAPSTDVGTDVSPASLARTEVASLVEGSPVGGLTPVPDLTPDDGGVEIPPVVEPAPQEEPPPALAGEEAKAPLAKDNAVSPTVKGQPRFVPDPSLLDHGQSHPEDADLYSTRG